MAYALVVLFGIMGISLRYGIDRLVPLTGGAFPVSTFAVNIVGSLAAGLVAGFGERLLISPLVQVALITGFCGGFTTMSAFALQSVGLLQQDRILTGVIYLVASPALSMCAALFGLFLARRIA